MILFYEPKPKCINAIERNVNKAVGADNPTRIHGYYGAFLFDLPPIYLSPRLSEIFASKPSVGDTLNTVLKRFLKEDYGEVSITEKYYNDDQRWVFGTHADMIGRYRTSIGLLVLELYASKGIIRLQGEKVEYNDSPK